MNPKVSSNFGLYSKLFSRIGLILAIPLLMYFWGAAIISNLANFWNVFTPHQAGNLLADWENTLTPPILINTAKAVKTTKVNLRGFSQEGLQVDAFVNGKLAATTRADKNGEFAFEGLKLSVGDNQVYVKAKDNQNNESSPSELFTIKYINQPPFLEVTNLSQTTELRQKTNVFSITGKTTPAAKVLVNGAQAFVDGNGNFSYLFSLNDGENNLTFEAEDEAGNKSVIERTVVFIRE